MEVQVQAYHLGLLLNLKEVDKKLEFNRVKRETSFRLYSIDTNTWIYVKKYGGIVFMNCSIEIRTEVLSKLAKKEGLGTELPYDEYQIKIGEKSEVEVDFDNVYVPELTQDTAHIIMLNLAQSVALEDYYNRSSILLDSVKKFAIELKNTGNINISKKAMRKFIGRTLMLKNRISENLFIFESSDLAWYDEDLAIIDRKLCEELEIKERYHGLQNQLDTIKENLELFNEILQHKYSSLLEWIIIILIFVEIVQLIVERIY